MEQKVEQSIFISCKSSQTNVSDNGENIVILCSILAKEQTVKRQPIDLVVVLDTSGSMAGEKISLCKKTLNILALRHLNEDDRFCLITFDSCNKVVFEINHMTNALKDTLKNSIKKIRLGTSTNLSSGLFKGLEVLKRIETDDLSVSGGRVKSLLLLTDGIMNEGITNQDSLISILENEYKNFNIKPTIFSLGYSSDSEPDILSRISKVGKGMFYSILSTDALPIAFADIMGGLSSIAAQNIELTLTTGSNNFSIAKVMTSFSFENNNNSAKVNINDIYAGETKDILFELMIEKGDENIQVNIVADYLDCNLKKSNKISNSITIQRCAGLYSGTFDIEISKQLLRYNSFIRMDMISNMAKKGEIKKAKEIAENDLKEFNEKIQELGLVDDDLIKEIKNYIISCIDGLQDRNVYLTTGQHSINSATFCVGSQRSNSAVTQEYSQGYSKYSTGSKKRMIESFSQAINDSDNEDEDEDDDDNNSISSFNRQFYLKKQKFTEL